MKVLFIRFSATGDVVLTTGPIDYFHRKFPDATIEVLTSVGGKEILTHLGCIHKIYTVPKGSSIFQILRAYRHLSNYDYIFDLQGSFKSKLVTSFAKGKFLKINKHSKERRAFVQSRKYKNLLQHHVVQKYAKVYLDAFKMEMPELEKLRPRFTDLKLTHPIKIPEQKYIVFHPYASQQNKEWPYFFELANLLIINNIKVVVVGNGDSHWPKEVSNYSNRTNINQLLSIIKNAAAVVTTDSGPMHMSVALQRPTISIFGPTTKELGFYPDFKRSIVIEDSDLKCRPCHVHGGNVCPLEHFQCMYNLSAQQVYNKLFGLLIGSKA